MAETGLLATISGPALSLLFFENARCVGDQMGFLLGEVVMYVTKNVTDSERQVESIRRHIDITGVLACPIAAQIYHETGKLHKDKLRAFIHDRSKEIVGWFRFRHNNRPALTLRDKILHKELSKYFVECNNSLPKEYFLACVLNATKTERLGTHKFRHILLRYEDGSYRPVPLRIKNLGGDAARHDGSDYMPTPVARISQESDVFTNFVRSLNLDTRNETGSELVTMIQKAAEYHAHSLIPIICESDREISEMEKEINDLKLKVISTVISKRRLSPNNERINEPNHRETMRMEGDSSVNMEMREHTPPRQPNVYSDHYAEKETSHPKKKGTQRPMSMINTMRSPNDSSQRSPSSRIPNSQDSRKSTDSEDLYNTSY